ncbi:DUF4153 domain-containing protein [Aureimonas pseudogalii]|uniref:DUF4153 domain-containing protein n=1 Tax=Aureimonas pseudogalii TaxID=1744844 RepID=A0A7W6EGG2_9HYPH|nr:DUF4153 domain-containing protein [Aureimonas pseudogalii]MBB3998295.1 hypothetical protein [Aureimonas pseudogalii]
MGFRARIERGAGALRRGLLQATSRFPVTALLVLAFGIVSTLTLHGRFADEMDPVRLLAVLAGAAAVSLAVSLAFEGRLRTRLAPVAMEVLAAAAVGAAIWFGRPFAIHAPALVISALCAVPLAATLGRGSPLRFWSFTLWACVGVALAFLSVLLFVFGLYLLLEMIRYLFRTDLFADADGYILTVGVTLVGPLFALGRLPATGEDAPSFDVDDRLVRTVRPLFDWVLAPLVLATALVLHVYVGRIALTGEVPRGQIGWIVASFSMLVLLLRIAADPFRDGPSSPLRWTFRGWPFLLALPLALLAYALTQRISAEGFTAERYYLALWSLAVFCILLAQLAKRLRGDIRVVAAVPVVLLALSTVGPWGVADTVGRSQSARIETAFGEVLARKPADRVPMAPNAAQVLRSRLVALDEVAELWRVRSLLSAEEASDPLWADRDAGLDEVVALLEIREGPDPNVMTQIFEGWSDDALDTSGFDRAYLSRPVNRSYEPDPRGLSLWFDGARLVIDLHGTRDPLDLGPFVSGLPPVGGERPAAASDFDGVTVGGRTVRVRVERLWKDGRNRLDAGAVTLLLRSAEWPAAATLPR